MAGPERVFPWTLTSLLNHTGQRASGESSRIMSGTDKRKQSLYFPESMLQEIQKEAARLDRSLSWIVQRCVKIGLPDIRKLPSVNEVGDEGADDVRGRDEQD